MKKSEKLISFILVFLQFMVLIAFMIRGKVIANSILPGIFQSMGIILGIWALISMSAGKLSVFPLPRNGAILITSGPYRFIRHPMYTSLLLIFTPLPIIYSDWIRWMLLVFLTMVLWLKMNLEEKKLIEKFGNTYQKYSERTKKVIPFIY